MGGGGVGSGGRVRRDWTGGGGARWCGAEERGGEGVRSVGGGEFRGRSGVAHRGWKALLL